MCELRAGSSSVIQGLPCLLFGSHFFLISFGTWTQQLIPNKRNIPKWVVFPMNTEYGFSFYITQTRVVEHVQQQYCLLLLTEMLVIPYPMDQGDNNPIGSSGRNYSAQNLW